jgi:hypothetical protein
MGKAFTKKENMGNSSAQANSKLVIKRGILCWVIQTLVLLVFTWLALFLLAGKLNWKAGWAFFVMNAVTQLMGSFLLIARYPAMLVEHFKAQAGTKNWDKLLAPAIAIYGSLAIFITVGLDARFTWSTLQLRRVELNLLDNILAVETRLEAQSA